MKPFRVGIVGLLQESNTFIQDLTTRAHFAADLIVKGSELRKRMAAAPHEVGGFFEGLDAHGIEVVPIFLARALPYGVIRKADFEELVEEMLAEIDQAGPLDGILAAPHGATVAEGYPDADGHWLAEVRKRIGGGVPLIATLDPHANLSPAMVAATDALIAYSTNPHLDQRETGRKAAELMVRTLAGEVHPTQAAAFPPMAINIQSQNTSEKPLQTFLRDAAAIWGGEKALSGSILFGFPYADVPEMGSAVLVVSDGETRLAQELADAIAKQMWDRRDSFDPEFLSVEAAIARSRGITERPVVFLDMGDNVGGGSPGNSTAIVQEWLCQGGVGRFLVVLHDPAAAEKAGMAGIGGVIEAEVGDSEAPLGGEWKVLSLSDGKFQESEARHGGFSEFDQGASAVLQREDSGLALLVTTQRMAPFSLAQLTSCELEPASFDFIVAKGVIAPRAAYEAIAQGGFLSVDSPGVTRADMIKLDYRHRRRPLFPFEKS